MRSRHALQQEVDRLRAALDTVRKIVENALYTKDDGSVCYPEVVRP